MVSPLQLLQDDLEVVLSKWIFNGAFYPLGAIEHWHQDKITKLIDFYSLENLTLYSYRARIISILKL